MQLDLRDSPNSLSFRALKGQRLTSWDLMRFVCEPPLPFMRLFHVHLPWYIDVEAQNPAGVTLFELFMALHSCMVRQIENADYYNVEMDAEARARVAEAWSASTDDRETARGSRTASPPFGAAQDARRAAVQRAFQEHVSRLVLVHEGGRIGIGTRRV